LIHTIPETGSTNADLAARLRGGEAVPEGFWLVADRQTAGSGRQGREWFDGAGNFMGSTVVYPGFGDPPAPSLALLAGLALFEVVSPLLPEPHRAMLKWPNDVLVGRAKLAGVLLEREGQAVIVGIGVNLASAPSLPDREATALSAYAPAPERDSFAEALARQFGIELERWRTFGLESIVNRWLAAGHPKGTPLQADGLAGAFAGLTPEGALQLRLADGSTRTIHAGEVNLAT
jgi:BirA family transcriptional regulator, biotin operon repressor / biotin---[acetyl-CoA-carboxylase] ligase